MPKPVEPGEMFVAVELSMYELHIDAMKMFLFLLCPCSPTTVLVLKAAMQSTVGSCFGSSASKDKNPDFQ